MALSGVRSSWLMLARKSDLALLARSSSSVCGSDGPAEGSHLVLFGLDDLIDQPFDLLILRVAVCELQRHRLVNLAIPDKVRDVCHCGQDLVLGGANPLDHLLLFRRGGL